ncbi:RNA polymerase sigma factor [Patescibacteria group bacterium]|nr:RNA polymerase sigma factor [Patescibacteria group bacterium]
MKDKFYLQLKDEIEIEGGGEFDDEELVKKSLDNPRLFGMFVEKYQDVFLRTATRVLKKKEESEDVVQEAFVKIYFNAKKFQRQPGIKFKSWAFKILLNCAFTRYRKLKKRVGDVEYMDEVLYSGKDNNSNLVDFSFEQKEKRDEIESVLNKMPEEMRDLVKEHYLNDRPYADIASEKGMSISALKMKLFRARKKFKEVMGNINE